MLKHDFNLVCDHYKLSKEARDCAWHSAMTRPEAAKACYAAIARSLIVPPQPIPVKPPRTRIAPQKHVSKDADLWQPIRSFHFDGELGIAGLLSAHSL